MKKKYKVTLTSVALAMVIALAFSACSAAPSEPAMAATNPPATAAAEAPDAPAATDMPAATDEAMSEKTFTLDELATFDGQDGRPAYIAIDGTVYDVSSVPQWPGGKHNGYTAGQDLTDAMASAPHGFSKLTGLPVVGKLAE